ncbi:hypothetical protein [Serratia phage vB_SmaM_Hera]|uniref:Uncharacterized protein n=1 Tax=Serratia phage vB_SmaM_Hera TaxID=2777369 RepID=A0A7T3N965_9CAUD|nr:hypothetical protein [Serratia phage vB_SmaM_Hera]
MRPLRKSSHNHFSINLIADHNSAQQQNSAIPNITKEHDTLSAQRAKSNGLSKPNIISLLTKYPQNLLNV